MDVVYFKSEEEGDGAYEGQIGRAYLHRDLESSDDEGTELGWMTLATARDVARDYGATLDIHGPSEREWDDASARTGSSLVKRLFREFRS